MARKTPDRERPAAAPDPEALAARAQELFAAGGLTCSEAILKAGCEALKMESHLVPHIALGLGGGVGLQGEVCGAVSGCALVLSLATAATTPDYPARKAATFAAVGRLSRDFARRCGSVRCRDISGLDLTREEDRKKLAESVKAERCVPAVAEAARILAEEIGALR